VSRLLPLYLRSRRVPVAFACSTGAVAVVAAAWSGLTDGGKVNAGLAVLTAALTAAPLVPTLAANDSALERTAALSWPPRRALHLIACCVAVAGLPIAARVVGTDFGPVEVLIRSAAGLIGLVGLGAALVGARYAWQLPLAWAALQCFLLVPGGPAWRQVALWMVQAPHNRTAAMTAATFLVGGLLAYAARVGPPVSAAEASLEQ
jgi:hypothetical protein